MLFAPHRLHIPDGFLTPAMSAVGWLLALGMIWIAVRQTRKQLDDRLVPVMGVLAAFVFAAQAVNFPVVAGTSGHLVGAALAAILLGPWAATLIMTAVVAIQGLLFQDGGLLVMGWNLVNMGVVAAFSGHLAYTAARRLAGESRPAILSAAFAAAWISVIGSAAATSIELAVSGTAPLALSMAAMTTVHALIGLGEGLITAAAAGLVLASRPALVRAGAQAPGGRVSTAVLLGLAAVFVVAALSPWASPSPDGLESVAERIGFLEQAQGAPFHLLADYSIPIMANPALATMVAVLLGALVVFAAAVVVGRVAARRHTAGG